MAKHYSLTAIAVLLIICMSSCSKNEEAQKPVYLSIPGLSVKTDYQSEGTSDQKITTVWILANGKAVGSFELPCIIPAFLKEGSNHIKLYPGINLNGISNTRAIYEGFRPIEFDTTYIPSGKSSADTLLIDSINRVTGYNDKVTINILEDFDQIGLNLAKTSRSKTNIEITSKGAFINPSDSSEDNGKSGMLYTTPDKDLAEIASIENYEDFPIGGANVYLEMNYKCNIPFTVGIIANTPTGVEQLATLTVYPKESWNKIYVNLVTEVSSVSNADSYKIFFLAEHNNALDTGKVFLDNLKLVY